MALGIGHRPITLSAYAGFAVVGAFAALMPGATAPVRLGLVLAAMLVVATAAQGVRWLERCAGDVRTVDADGGLEGRGCLQSRTAVRRFHPTWVGSAGGRTELRAPWVTWIESPSTRT